MGVAPTARITASGWASWMAWAVAGWFRCTATPRVSSWVWYQALSSLSSALKSWAPAGIRLPPRWPLFSHRVTVWPRLAAQRAASMPATPPPTTRTDFFFPAGTVPKVASRAAWGFTAQPVRRPIFKAPMHPWLQPMQGRISWGHPMATFRGKSGSAREARPRTTPSIFPSAMAWAARAGSFIRPPQRMGIFTCSFTAADRGITRPFSM